MLRSNCYFLFFFVLFVSKVLLLFKYTFSLLECFRSRTHTQIHTHKHTKSKKYSYYNLVCLSAKNRVIFSCHIYSLHQLKTSFHYSNNCWIDSPLCSFISRKNQNTNDFKLRSKHLKCFVHQDGKDPRSSPPRKVGFNRFKITQT